MYPNNRNVSNQNSGTYQNNLNNNYHQNRPAFGFQSDNCHAYSYQNQNTQNSTHFQSYPQIFRSNSCIFSFGQQNYPKEQMIIEQPQQNRTNFSGNLSLQFPNNKKRIIPFEKFNPYNSFYNSKDIFNNKSVEMHRETIKFAKSINNWREIPFELGHLKVQNVFSCLEDFVLIYYFKKDPQNRIQHSLCFFEGQRSHDQLCLREDELDRLPERQIHNLIDFVLQYLENSNRFCLDFDSQTPDLLKFVGLTIQHKYQVNKFFEMVQPSIQNDGNPNSRQFPEISKRNPETVRRSSESEIKSQINALNQEFNALNFVALPSFKRNKRLMH